MSEKWSQLVPSFLCADLKGDKTKYVYHWIDIYNFIADCNSYNIIFINPVGQRDGGGGGARDDPIQDCLCLHQEH